MSHRELDIHRSLWRKFSLWWGFLGILNCRRVQRHFDVFRNRKHLIEVVFQFQFWWRYDAYISKPWLKLYFSNTIFKKKNKRFFSKKPTSKIYHYLMLPKELLENVWNCDLKLETSDHKTQYPAVVILSHFLKINIFKTKIYFSNTRQKRLKYVNNKMKR